MSRRFTRADFQVWNRGNESRDIEGRGEGSSGSGWKPAPRENPGLCPFWIVLREKFALSFVELDASRGPSFSLSLRLLLIPLPLPLFSFFFSSFRRELKI